MCLGLCVRFWVFGVLVEVFLFRIFRLVGVLVVIVVVVLF